MLLMTMLSMALVSGRHQMTRFSHMPVTSDLSSKRQVQPLQSVRGDKEAGGYGTCPWGSCLDSGADLGPLPLSPCPSTTRSSERCPLAVSPQPVK